MSTSRATTTPYYGVSLLNDGKYGHHIRHVLRLTLLKECDLPQCGRGSRRAFLNRQRPAASGRLATAPVPASFGLNDSLIVRRDDGGGRGDRAAAGGCPSMRGMLSSKRPAVRRRARPDRRSGLDPAAQLMQRAPDRAPELVPAGACKSMEGRERC